MSAFSCSSGLIKCSFGVCPSSINHLPISGVFAGNPHGNIMDNKPFINVAPFGMCTSPANPAVAASFGMPQPCLPNPITPWFPGTLNVMVGNMPSLNNSSQTLCAFGGVINFLFAGQVFVNS